MRFATQLASWLAKRPRALVFRWGMLNLVPPFRLRRGFVQRSRLRRVPLRWFTLRRAPLRWCTLPLGSPRSSGRKKSMQFGAWTARRGWLPGFPSRHFRTGIAGCAPREPPPHPRACSRRREPVSARKSRDLNLLGYCPAERTLRLAFGAAAAFGAGHGFMKP